MGTLGNLAFHGFGFAFGFFNFVVMTGIAAFRDGAFTKSMSEEEKRELSIGRTYASNLIVLTDKYNSSEEVLESSCCALEGLQT